MIIDIVFAFALILGFYHGYQKGILYSFVSIVGVLIAALASMKLTLWFSGLINQWFKISPTFLPFVSMVLIFIIIMLNLKLIAYLLERFLAAIKLTQGNKIGGGLLWVGISLFLLSTCIWLLDKGDIIRPELRTSSFSYKMLQPIAPWGFHLISYLSPMFKEWYEALGAIFEHVGKE